MLFTLLQARNSENKIRGHFENPDDQTQLKDCDAKEHNTITHKNNNKKFRITATWVAPSGEALDKSDVISFHYTIVEEKHRFWAKQVVGQYHYDETNNADHLNFHYICVIVFSIVFSIYQFY